jgi:hypothetical protein
MLMLMVRATVTINLYLCLTRHQAMKAYWEVDLLLKASNGNNMGNFG